MKERKRYKRTLEELGGTDDLDRNILKGFDRKKEKEIRLRIFNERNKKKNSLSTGAML